MYWIIFYRKLKYSGMALWPFIILRERHMKSNEMLINHERIHHRQQLEMFLVPFYLVYSIHYLVNLYKYRSRRLAYLNVVFEVEAYDQEQNFRYLSERKRFAWMDYFRKQEKTA